MSLPTTSSDDAIGWERSLWAALGALGISAFLLWVAMIVIDPYDSGKFGWLGIEVSTTGTTFTAAASRARNPQFDSAVIGNSTAQMLDPAQLSQATGLRFVQLYMTGAGRLKNWRCSISSCESSVRRRAGVCHRSFLVRSQGLGA